MTFVGLNMLKYFAQTGSIRWDNEFFTVRDFKNIINEHDSSRSICIQAAFGDRRIRNYELDVSAEERKFYFAQRRTKNTIAIPQMSRLWYVRSNRTRIPFSSSVEYSGLTNQPLSPEGSNVLTFLLERYTEQNEYWSIMRDWLQKVDQNISNIIMPVRGNQTFFENLVGNIPVNLSCMGSGIQSVLTVMAAAIFSPKDSTIVIEEPEVFLHPRSQESIVDLFNYLVGHHSKQIIFSTHSWSMILPYIKDIVTREDRGPNHEHVEASKLNIDVYDFENGDIAINPYDLSGKTYQEVRRRFKNLWG